MNDSVAPGGSPSEASWQTGATPIGEAAVDATGFGAAVRPLMLPELGGPRAAQADALDGEAGEDDGAGEVELADGAEVIEIVDADEDVRDEFERRVEDRMTVAVSAHPFRRVVFSPREMARHRDLDGQAAVWVPVTTFAVTAVCAVVVVLVASKVAGTPGRGKGSDLFVVLLTLGFLAAGFFTVIRSQAHFDEMRPSGRDVRNDVADAYETVRDSAPVFLELGVQPEALGRVADLLPQAEALVTFLVNHERRGGMVKGHPAYLQVIRMGAEVTVLTDMAEERLGRRSLRRRDREVSAEREEPEVVEQPVTPFETLADLAVMIGAPVPYSPRPAVAIAPVSAANPAPGSRQPASRFLTGP